MIFKRFRKKDNPDKARRGKRRSKMGPSIITAEVVIEGSLLSGGDLQIDGEVNGDVRAHAVVVDVNGLVHGQVAGESVIVRGRVIGPIKGLHVHLMSGAHVEGDVVNETISIENGAYIDGSIHRVEDPLSATFTTADPQADHAYPAPTAHQPDDDKG